jgi:hypothetical protein
VLIALNGKGMVFTDDPAKHVVQLGTGFDGVSSLATITGNCSGALLWTGIDVLTAAHCLDDLANIPGAEVKDFEFRFIYQDANQKRAVMQIASSQVFFAPGWRANQDPALGNDLAVVRLAEAAPALVDRYNIYRNNDEVGRVGRLFGYGKIGTGDTGEMPQNDIVDYGGRSVIESRGDFLNLSPYGPGHLSGNLLIYDFSNCDPAKDAFAFYFNQPDTLCVADETNTATGDSGGPTFLSGLIAGVHSFGFDFEDIPGRVPPNSDIDNKINSTYGEFSADTRVSSRAEWIDSVVAPEPGTFGILAVVLAALGVRRHNARLRL